jgi:hypothetical protein
VKKKIPRSHFIRLLMMTIAFVANLHLARAEEKPATPESATATVAPQEAAAPPSEPAQPAAAAEEGEYEIDYEPEDSDEMVKPTPAKSAHGKKSSQASAPTANAIGGSGGIQGSRAKHRFTPILKSETKSIYQKDGKALDVDSD